MSQKKHFNDKQMQSTNILMKRKLLFEVYSVYDPIMQYAYPIPDRKIRKLEELGIKTIFVFSSEPVDHEAFLQLINRYKYAGFDVKLNHLDTLGPEQIPAVHTIVEDIYTAFKHGGCLMISYGRSFALTIISCFYISRGKDPKDAIESVRKLSMRLIDNEHELAFLNDFHKYIKTGSDNSETAKMNTLPGSISEIQKPAGHKPEKKPAQGKPAPDQQALTLDEFESGSMNLDDSIPLLETANMNLEEFEEVKQSQGEEELTLEKNVPRAPAETAEIPAVAAAPAPQPAKIKAPPPPENEEQVEPEREIKTEKPVAMTGGKFYESIRFKMISIISLIIIVSLSMMIFLATYFFKGYNTLKVQESNLTISDVTAQKIEAEVDKRKFIATAMLKKTQQDTDHDVLFAGFASPEGGNGVTFTQNAYNDPLIARMQTTPAKIQEIMAAQGKVFARSFNGENVIHNISQPFNSPVAVLSFPATKNAAGQINSIMVNVINLEVLLKAFRSAGIVKSFMINDKGEIIAHPETAIVLSGGNYINLPIVKEMLKSKVNNGQTNYKDENGLTNLGSYKKIPSIGCGIISYVSEEKAFEEVYNIQRRNLYLMIIVVTAAILIIYFFAKSLTTPILVLVGAARKIKGGDYKVTIRATTRDEIGVLTGTFTEMAQGLEEREKIKSAFGKFVNKEIAEAAMKGELKLGGERKEVAVFFSDIRSFTSISEKLEPEEVVEFLNQYMTKMVQCIDRTSGVVDKFIGDAIMAVWGTPISHGNDTENAVNAALQMREDLILFNEWRGKDEKHPLIHIGCGINSGPVLAGQIGSDNRMEYTVIGDTVNLASRVESLNKPFGTDILISSDSYEKVSDIFAVEKMQKIKVKGKEDPQQIYAVLGRLDDPNRSQSLAELQKRVGIKPKGGEGKSGEPIDIEEGEVKYEILEE